MRNWDPYQNTTVKKLRGCTIELQGSLKVGIQYISVSDMIDKLGCPPLSQRGQEARIIINGLAQVPFECVIIEAHDRTRRKHNMKFEQIGHMQLYIASMDSSLPPKAISAWNGLDFAEESPILAVFRFNYL